MRDFVDRRQSGFTLIELLVVIAIIGVMAAAIITVLNPQHFLAEGRDEQRKSDLKRIQSALEQYRADVGQYPTTEITGGYYDAGNGQESPPCGFPLIHNGITYIQSWPCDPSMRSSTGAKVGYDYDPLTYQYYTLTTCLENANDPQIDTTLDDNGNYCAQNGSPKQTYTVTSPGN